MPSSNLIHIRLDPHELIDAKREILSTEASFIKSLQHLKEYHALRSKELNLKKRLLRKLKEARSGLNKLEKEFPKLEIPKIIKKKVRKEGRVVKEITPKKDNLQIQLEEIQRKLRELEK